MRRALGAAMLRLIIAGLAGICTWAPAAAQPPAAEDRIMAIRARGELLESALVHGQHYGTPAGPVRDAIERGLCVALVIDVQGGFQVRKKAPDALLVFIQVPSLQVLEARLRARGTDSEATIERRLVNARREIELAREYDVQVVNDDLERAVEQLATILSQNGCGA